MNISRLKKQFLAEIDEMPENIPIEDAVRLFGEAEAAMRDWWWQRETQVRSKFDRKDHDALNQTFAKERRAIDTKLKELCAELRGND